MRRRKTNDFVSVIPIVLAVWCSVVGLCASSAGAGEDTATIVIRGTSALMPVVEKWASSYSSATPGLSFDIEARGSDEGVKDLLMGRADVVSVSRPMSPEEHSAFREKGLVAREIVVARMGIAVVTHPSNPVRSLQVGQLAGVFAGEIQNWEVCGGPDQSITVVRKESGWSPTFFRSRVMAGKEYLSGGLIVDSKEDVLEEVSQRPWAIGVTGMPEALPALDRVNLLRLESGASDGASTYALSRPLFFLTVGESVAVQSFLDFVSSTEAQQSIVDTGFFPAQQGDRLEDGE